ncbi:unnamed protein product [Rangifer tarandus platyrhynchus]|uniref:Secreted protein n=1 Tax=Rangifer tarandus platyrhynchus TaxID=3082113 RepID=A0ABN8XJ86_RANTA|nr:unnamed protein product [Rangifer tarandus platyrhynchus]
MQHMHTKSVCGRLLCSALLLPCSPHSLRGQDDCSALAYVRLKCLSNTAAAPRNEAPGTASDLSSGYSSVAQ